MCHVSDPCASSPQPLDQTIIGLDGGDGMELCFLVCLPILSKPPFSVQVFSETPCNQRWRGGRKQAMNDGAERS
jgi:hypothetical protein